MYTQNNGGWEWGSPTSSKYSRTYPTLIFDADISSIFSEVLYCELVVFTRRNMEGSPLTERKKQADPIFVTCELKTFLIG